MKYFSMFSGIGGFELGIKKAKNWECVGFCEIDKHAIQTYTKHFPKHKNYGSATDINPEELPDFDILCGGFPCQAFSIAGQRMGFEDTRGTLFFEIARIAKAKRPQIIFVENVKGLLNHDNGRTFATIIATLDELGYNAEWQVLNSKHFGVPQNRERVFIIGHLRGTSRPQIFPIGEIGGQTKRMEQTKEIIYAQKSDREIARIYDPKGIAPTLHLKTGGWQEPKVAISNFSPREFKWQTENCPTVCARDYKDPKIVAMRWRRTEKGKIARKESQKKGKDYTPFNEGHRELTQSEDNISGCITGALNKDALLGNDTLVRRLTPTECERLQGFPDGWTEGVSDTQRYKQLGNAVTVNVIEAIVKEI